MNRPLGSHARAEQPPNPYAYRATRGPRATCMWIWAFRNYIVTRHCARLPGALETQTANYTLLESRR